MVLRSLSDEDVDGIWSSISSFELFLVSENVSNDCLRLFSVYFFFLLSIFYRQIPLLVRFSNTPPNSLCSPVIADSFYSQFRFCIAFARKCLALSFTFLWFTFPLFTFVLNDFAIVSHTLPRSTRSDGFQQKFRLLITYLPFHFIIIIVLFFHFKLNTRVDNHKMHNLTFQPSVYLIFLSLFIVTTDTIKNQINTN